MSGGVVVTHGPLATELVSAAEMIAGDQRQLTALCIGRHDDAHVARELIQYCLVVDHADEGVSVL